MAKEISKDKLTLKPDGGSINKPNIGDADIVIRGGNPKLPTMENPPPPPPKDEK